MTAAKCYFQILSKVCNIQLKNDLPAVVGHFSIDYYDHYRITQNNRQI
jgi:hypothetical protein